MDFQVRIAKMQEAAKTRKLNTVVEPEIDLYEKIKQESSLREAAKHREEKFNRFLTTLPIAYQGKIFQDFNINFDVQKPIKNIAYRFVETANERLKTNTNLILHGSTGTGKTLLSLIMAQALAKSGFSVRYESSLQFLRLFRDKNFSSHTEFQQLLSDYANVQFLILDEASESRVNGNYLSSWEREMLFALIDVRYQIPNRSIFMISNRTQREIQQNLSERIYDRLQKNAITLAFNWSSYR